MITDNQKQAIERMTEAQLLKQISVLHSSKTENKDELITYCDKCLRRLDRSEAMVEETDFSDFGDI